MPPESILLVFNLTFRTVLLLSTNTAFSDVTDIRSLNCIISFVSAINKRESSGFLYLSCAILSLDSL